MKTIVELGRNLARELVHILILLDDGEVEEKEDTGNVS
jgi:hypothetical protein